MKKAVLFAVGAIVLFTNCEKDDICDPNTPTTPQLVIDFYDFKDKTVLKPVPSLVVTGVGIKDSLNTFTGSQIKIPLKTRVDSTQYHFVLNNNGVKNEDKLQFDYSRKDVYISRACGFKTLFTLKSKPTWTNSAPADTLWIKDIEIAKPNINDENETHVKIFF